MTVERQHAAQSSPDLTCAWLYAANCSLYEDDDGPAQLNIASHLEPHFVSRVEAFRDLYLRLLLEELDADAARIASLVPGAVLVRLPTAGHSVLDSRERAALKVAKAVKDGRIDELPAQAAALDDLPGSWAVRLVVAFIGAGAVIESLVPVALPRVLHRAVATS